MKRLFPVLCVLWSLIASHAFAGSATWNLNPASNDWNTPANWTPETAPSEASDTATFEMSNTADISVTTELTLDAIVFNPGASSYAFQISENNPFGIIVLSGAGVVNNSGVVQNFTGFDAVNFSGTATAGSDVVYTNQDVGGSLPFWMNFADTSDAGSATFVNVGGDAPLGAGSIHFNNSSSAADSTIYNMQGRTSGGVTQFLDSSTAGSSTIVNYQYGFTGFFTSSLGGTATLIADGGTVHFQGQSNGQLARIELLDGGVLDLGTHVTTSPMTIGSLEGDDGTVRLFQQQLTTGGNGLSTSYGGTITGGGSLRKIGTESLTLTGANTYKGGTTIQSGTLLVAGATGSATGTGSVQVNGGIFGGTGTVKGAVTVGSTTGTTSATLAPGGKRPGMLTTAKSLTFETKGRLQWELGLKPNATQASEVSANGVTVQSGAKFVVRVQGSQTLSSGTVFTVINNTASTPISGTFSNLPDDGTITAGPNTLQASYEGGDGNDLTLTVVQ